MEKNPTGNQVGLQKYIIPIAVCWEGLHYAARQMIQTHRQLNKGLYQREVLDQPSQSPDGEIHFTWRNKPKTKEKHQKKK